MRKVKLSGKNFSFNKQKRIMVSNRAEKHMHQLQICLIPKEVKVKVISISKKKYLSNYP